MMLGHGAQTSREPAQDGEGERRVIEQHLLEVPGRQTETARRRLRDDLSRAWQSIEHGQLAKEVARSEDGQGLAVAHDADPALHDDEEAGPDLALTGDDASCRIVDLGRLVANGGQVIGLDTMEQRTASEELGPSIAGQGHRRLSASSSSEHAAPRWTCSQRLGPRTWFDRKPHRVP